MRLSRDANAQANGGIRRRRGLYAIVIVPLQIDLQRQTNPKITAAELHAYFRDLYSGLLDNSAVSGVALALEWRGLNPNPPPSVQPYDWSYLDDAFSSVAAWNGLHTAQAPKTIQLSISAGFFSPEWVLDRQRRAIVKGGL